VTIERSHASADEAFLPNDVADETWLQEDSPQTRRGLMMGVGGMLAIAIFCWPAAISYGAAILVSDRRRYRAVGWVGVGLGSLGLIVTMVLIVNLATAPTGGVVRR
jgi:hypothetical protein